MKTWLLAAALLPITALARPWTPPPDPMAPPPPPAESFRAGPPPSGVLAPPMARPDMDHRAREDDVRDLWTVDTTLAQLDRATAARDIRLLRWVDARAEGLLGDEVHESQREAERARFEAGRGNPWRLRQAQWKLSQVVQLDRGYRSLGWRLDPGSVAQRRAILVGLDRLNRRELAAAR